MGLERSRGLNGSRGLGGRASQSRRCVGGGGNVRDSPTPEPACSSPLPLPSLLPKYHLLPGPSAGSLPPHTPFKCPLRSFYFFLRTYYVLETAVFMVHPSSYPVG